MKQVPSFTDPFQSAAAPPEQPEPASVEPSLNVMGRDEAFALLREVVHHFEVTGRQPLAAGIKPEMQRRSSNRFSEPKLGYTTFREFVEDAARRGVVNAQPEGPHLRLHVPGVTLPSTTNQFRGSRTSSASPIPHDLWVAFVDWDQNKRRVYDRETGKAWVFTAAQATQDSGQQADMLALIRADSGRFIDISPIGFATQLGWMKHYANTLPNASDRRLLAPLLEQDPKPANAFSIFLRRNRHLEAGWKTLKVERVQEVIRAWMAEHGIDVGSLAVRLDLQRSMPPAPPTDTGFVYSKKEAEKLRGLVLAAVHKMSVADLLRLPIPVEYLVEPE